jgi:hypothetical protein
MQSVVKYMKEYSSNLSRSSILVVFYGSSWKFQDDKIK